MTDSNILQRNLLALSSFDPPFSSLLSRTEPTREVTFIKSKDEHLIPVMKRENEERLIPLHSKYNPIREGEKLFSAYENTGYLVFLGFGAGYHILPFIKSKKISNILIIDMDISLFRRIIENIDLRSVIIDNRVKFLIDKEPGEIKQYILKNYMPAVAGNLTTVPLYSRLNMEKKYFMDIVDSIKCIISQVADDYTVQARFGKKWFNNTLQNLRAAGKSTSLVKHSKKVIVTGAGPSLENQVRDIKRLKKNASLIATDTSLPTLLSFDLIPDMVISIDCQQISYHHFLKGIPPGIPLILDLASPPILTRLTDNLLFFSSGHPFSQYVTKNWRRFPAIDTSGGNVSHAAISLADSLGAETIYLAGLDFSFPEGKTYSRDSYQYNYFRTYEKRLTPLETHFFVSIFRNKRVIKEKIHNYIRYTTKPMINYKERLEKAITGIDARVEAIPGKGIPLLLPGNKRIKKIRELKQIFAQGPATRDWSSFLGDYRDKIKALKAPYYPVVKYLYDLENAEKDLWTTQYPAAAAIKEYTLNEEADGPEVLKATRKWTISRLEKVLKDRK